MHFLPTLYFVFKTITSYLLVSDYGTVYELHIVDDDNSSSSRVVWNFSLHNSCCLLSVCAVGSWKVSCVASQCEHSGRSWEKGLSGISERLVKHGTDWRSWVLLSSVIADLQLIGTTRLSIGGSVLVFGCSVGCTGAKLKWCCYVWLVDESLQLSTTAHHSLAVCGSAVTVPYYSTLLAF